MTMNEILENDLFKAFSTASGHVYIYVCDVKKDLSRWSQNAVEYFDMPGEYLENAAGIWCEKIHPDDRKKYMDDIEHVFSGQTTRHKCEYRALNRYGDYVWLECRGTMILAEDGSPKVFAGMMTRLDARNKYDPLTNLKTIYEFSRYDFSGGSGSILLLGIDSFRQVINNFGYSFGDTVLFEFCKGMKELSGEHRQVYRMEGDEFIIISPGDSREETRKLFEKIRKMASRLSLDDGGIVNISISGGGVLYPDDGLKRDALLSNMEHSLEHAKKYDRGKLVFFSEDIARQHNRSIQIRHAVTEDIHNQYKGFELYYQPLVDVKSQRVVCCEALLRWFHDSAGPVSAGELVKFLEHSGEILEVGYWIVDQVFQKAKRWQEKFGGLMVGFNVSYLQFKDSLFVDRLIQMAKEYQLNPEYITIELTESSKVEDFQDLAKSFERLREFGFKISLDDFGIAYSTLLLIRNLPANSVKIDHSFIRNLTTENTVDLAIIESVVSLCRQLNINVVAEGVENREILEIMKQYPITFFQGYYFAKPMPVDQFESIIFKTYEY